VSKTLSLVRPIQPERGTDSYIRPGLRCEKKSVGFDIVEQNCTLPRSNTARL